MTQINYEKFVSDMVKPLVCNPDEVVVKTFSEDEEQIVIQVMVNANDLGRVIGKKGRVANSIRTLAYASSSRFGKKIEIQIDSF